MRDLIQSIHMVGPTDRDERALLIAIASFADGDGVLKGWELGNLMWITGFPELTVKRRLNTLQRAGWLFVFGGAEDQETLYVINLKNLAKRALAREPTRTMVLWAEGILGVTQLPRSQRAREVKYR